MKVIFVQTDFRIYWPARLNALKKFLHGKGIEFDVIEIAGAGSNYYFASESLNHPAFWHCIFPSKKIEEISANLANNELRKKLDQLQPDIVFSGPIAFPSGSAAIRWTNENKKKSVIFDDARLKDVQRNWFINFIKKRIYSAVDAILCPSPTWNETFYYFGFTDNNIFHGIDVVDNSFWTIEDKCHKIILPEKYILSAGRQIPEKNFMFLLKAYLKYMLVLRDPLHIVLVGEGTEHDRIKFFVEENRLESFVHLYPFMTQEQLRSINHEATWFILPSLRETWGLVINEAMATGLPVLVSNQAGCASTLVTEGINGFTFSPDNIEELSELLLKIHKLSVIERRSMGQKSIEIISEWGLNRFCNGVHDAILFVSDQNQKNPGILTWLILKFWKGRYRPT